MDEGRKNVKIFCRCCWKERGPRGFLVKAPALALQRKMSEQRRVLAGLGEDVERKKGGEEIILNIFRLENYFQFPGAVENDQEVKRFSWKNCYLWRWLGGTRRRRRGTTIKVVRGERREARNFE